MGLGGEARSVRHHLTVLAAPVITMWDTAKEVVAGQDVTIRSGRQSGPPGVASRCEATGNPPPVISWSKLETGKVRQGRDSENELELKHE